MADTMAQGEAGKSICSRPAEIRTERGFSQEKLALESEYPRTYVGVLERGLQNPSLRTITRLAKILDVSAAEVVRRFEEKMGKH